jgi:hypothetical protein
MGIASAFENCKHQVQNGYWRAALDEVARGPIEQLTAATEAPRKPAM